MLVTTEVENRSYGAGQIYKLVLAARDVGDVHVVGRGAKILKLLASEDVEGDKVDLGVTVLASLGSRHIDDLARAALDDDVTVLAQSRALHGEGRGRAGVGGLEGVIMLRYGQVSTDNIPSSGIIADGLRCGVVFFLLFFPSLPLSQQRSIRGRGRHSPLRQPC